MEKTFGLLILLLAGASDRPASDPAVPVPAASAIGADSADRLRSPALIDAPGEAVPGAGGGDIVFQEPPTDIRSPAFPAPTPAPREGQAGAEGIPDTLELPPLTTRGRGNDSFSREFRKYWAVMEKQEGIDKLRDQLRSNDLDKSRYPRWYLFDSSVVIMPFPPAIFLRKRDKRARDQ